MECLKLSKKDDKFSDNAITLHFCIGYGFHDECKIYERLRMICCILMTIDFKCGL